MNDLDDPQQIRIRRRDRLAFFRGFLQRPEQVGSVIPSSRFLERRIVDVAEVAAARLVVELGPGTGGTTQAILAALPKNSRLLAIEINPDFAARLESSPDPRLIVYHGSAENIQKALTHYNLAQPDVVISGIPFSTMPPMIGRRILHAVWSALAPGGRFVAYQFRGHVATLDRRLLGKPETELELLNVPPMRIFRWRKQD